MSSLPVWGLENDRHRRRRHIEDHRRPVAVRVGAVPGNQPEEVLRSAGSRYTYAATPLAATEADERGLKRLALVGMSCQASISGSLPAHGVNKWKRRVELTIGLLCSKTFTWEGQAKMLAEHGIDIADVVKINIKGKYLVWTRDGGHHEVPLKPFHAFTGPGCSCARTSRPSTGCASPLPRRSGPDAVAAKHVDRLRGESQVAHQGKAPAVRWVILQ